LRNEGETTRGSVSVSLRVEGKSGPRAAVSFRVEGKSGSRAARRFWFHFVSSGARFRETGFDFLVLSVTLPTVGLQVTPSEPSAEAGGTSYSLALNVSTLKLRTASHVLLDRSKLADLTLSQLRAPSCVLSTFDALAMTELALQVTRTLFSSRIIHKFDCTHPYCAAVYF